MLLTPAAESCKQDKFIEIRRGYRPIRRCLMVSTWVSADYVKCIYNTMEGPRAGPCE